MLTEFLGGLLLALLTPFSALEKAASSILFVVLDEATSALDVNTEKHLYELLNQRDMACISVGHRPTLKNYHETVLEITENKGGRLLPAASYQFT